MDLGNGVKMEMVLIPAGEFLMGTSGNSDDEKQHRVRITKPFYLGRYLVTQEQWLVVMGDNHSNFKGPKNPMEQVSWDRCQQFLDKLNAKAGEGKFSLPTEVQWEYGCRAGSTTNYYFGDNEARLGDYAWYYKNSGSQTHPVGEKKPNAWGWMTCTETCLSGVRIGMMAIITPGHPWTIRRGLLQARTA